MEAPTVMNMDEALDACATNIMGLAALGGTMKQFAEDLRMNADSESRKRMQAEQQLQQEQSKTRRLEVQLEQMQGRSVERRLEGQLMDAQQKGRDSEERLQEEREKTRRLQRELDAEGRRVVELQAQLGEKDQIITRLSEGNAAGSVAFTDSLNETGR